MENIRDDKKLKETLIKNKQTETILLWSTTQDTRAHTHTWLLSDIRELTGIKFFFTRDEIILHLLRNTIKTGLVCVCVCV